MSPVAAPLIAIASVLYNPSMAQRRW